MVKQLFLSLFFFASIIIGNIPLIFPTFPSSDNSPIKTVFFKNSFKDELVIFPLDINIPIAIGKSNFEPSFFVFAGAKFIIILLLFSLIPVFL